MPQLDHFSFFSQVFWVLFFFTAFYFLNLRQTLPAVASILKVRKRILQKSQNAFESMQANKGGTVVESHTEFFSFVKTLAVTLENPTPFLNLNAPGFVRASFNSEFHKVVLLSLVSRMFSRFVRKTA